MEWVDRQQLSNFVSQGMILEGPLVVPDPGLASPFRILFGRILNNILPELQMGK